MNQLIIASFVFANLYCFAQSTLSLGAKIGLGGSPLPVHSTLRSDVATDHVYSGTTLTTGVILQYLVGNRIGIESGAHVNHYSYYRNDAQFWRRRIWKGPADLEMINYQIPLIVVYRIKVPAFPFRTVMLAGGTSLDWVVTDESTHTYQEALYLGWLKNIYCSMRISNERMKGNRLECGLDFQYSLNRFVVSGTNDRSIPQTLSSRLSFLSINLYYFFLHKTFVKQN
jgi:hypothetical protein